MFQTEPQGQSLLVFLLAAYAVYGLAVKKKLWYEPSRMDEKMLRWLIAGLLFLGLGFLVNKLEYIYFLKTYLIWPFVKSFFLLFVFFFGGLWIASRWKK